MWQKNPVGFFDGASKKGVCEAGFVIKLNNSRIFRGWLKASLGSNTRDEVIGLWSLLHYARIWGVDHFQALGDSQVVINWVKGKTGLKTLELPHWLDSIVLQKKVFSWITFDHVYKDFNQEVDDLSKLDFGDMDSIIHYSFNLDGVVTEAGNLVFF